MYYVTMDNDRKYESFPDCKSGNDCRQQFHKKWPLRILWFIREIRQPETFKHETFKW